MDVVMRRGAQVPVLIITGSGEVKIQGLNNYEQISQASLLPVCENFTASDLSNNSSKVLAGNNHAPEKNDGNALANLFFESGTLEDFMEVCIIYKCKQCSYSSDSQEDFHKHCLTHLANDASVPCTERLESTTYIYLCSHCNEAFDSSEETKKHMVHEHNLQKNAFDSDELHGSVNTVNVFIESDKGSTVRNYGVKKKRKLGEIIEGYDPSGNAGNSNYFCRKRHCKYKFKSEEDLDIHEKCHLDSELNNGTKRLYKCFSCNELFNGWHSCCSHLYKAHKIDCDLLKCPICETYRTSLPLRLENHIRIHSDVRAFTCKHCGKTFKQASQLRNHIVVHADKNGTQKPNWSRSKQCNICFKMYSDSKSLKKHKEEVHSKLRPFVCSVCGHASARKAMLLMHQRQHTGHKPYHCQLCNFKTADHNSLRKHLMRHTGVRPYKCPHCDYTAIQSGSYKNHMKIVHPNLEGMYMCSICRYKTISEDNYIRHISDHLTGLIKDNLATEEISLNCVTNLFNVSHFIDETLNENNQVKVQDSSNEYLCQNECSMIASTGGGIPHDTGSSG